MAILDHIQVGSDNREVVDAAARGRLDTIEGEIQSGTSSSNKLVNKEYVDQSIATADATFRGTFASIDDLYAYTGPKDKNDYVFVADVDSAGNAKYRRYKYNGSQWVFEYDINNTAFTSGQWATINSGMVAADKTKLDALPNNADLQSALNNKAAKAGSLSQDFSARALSVVGRGTGKGIKLYSSSGNTPYARIVVESDLQNSGIDYQLPTTGVSEGSTVNLALKEQTLDNITEEEFNAIFN